MSSAERTTDHSTIRKWAEDRGGRPAVVRTKGDKGGVLRFDFGEKEESLEEIDWSEFFAIFDESDIELLYQDKASNGTTSRFFKFVRKDEADD
ncbi:hypothetical protein [Sphingobium sp.]|uniref:hypothetical protein n=1 Tax=Sphingobium sp. TaxID=1912891 RepID=UPI002CE4D3C1|nr:hypothetical protein [Sphingobium sp.]HUD95296.1 hypothetical protein [Sphingobium sp.]